MFRVTFEHASARSRASAGRTLPIVPFRRRGDRASAVAVRSPAWRRRRSRTLGWVAVEAGVAARSIRHSLLPLEG